MSRINPVLEWYEYLVHMISGLSLFADETGQLLLYVGVGAAIIMSIATFLRCGSLRSWQVIGSVATIPLMILIVAVVPQSFRGTPDDRCHEYKNGTLPLSLMGAKEVPVDIQNPYGDSVMMLLVFSEEMWGNDPHLCRVFMNSDVGRTLLKHFQDLGDGGAGSDDRGSSSRRVGKTVFTFANGFGDSINVTLTPDAKEKTDKGEPERPPSQEELRGR